MVKYGLPAIALLGTGTKEQVEALKSLDYRKYILCLDNDTAGRAGMNKLYKSLYKYKLINYLIAPVGKDINDFVNEGKNFLKNFSKTP
jgi:DNA primase